MTTEPKPAMSAEDVVAEIKRGAGSQSEWCYILLDTEAAQLIRDYVEAEVVKAKTSTTVTTEDFSKSGVLPWDHRDDAINILQQRADDLQSRLDAALAENARLRMVFDAAYGLTHGEDWNNGTQAKLHGYRKKLIDAVKACCDSPTATGEEGGVG